ncbi:unnamed protein product [Mytilus edulis]|uniref:Uncharacterized protein n=1 Tax=Mytilus edulis TaxID=6550 RepID=A0A8S3UF47_MYTED|nr:unnamed protein product [Mytilus edulis]
MKVHKHNRCIDLIRSVTKNLDSHLYMQSCYSDVKKEKLEKYTKQAFDEMQPICNKQIEINIYSKIISHDLKYHDPYTTIKQFKLFKEQDDENLDFPTKLKFRIREVPENIPAEVDSSSTGTVTSVASISTPTTSCSSDTVNLTTTTPSINPIMTPTITRSDQGNTLHKLLIMNVIDVTRVC